MLEWLRNTVANHEWNSWLAIGLYWLPASLCAFGYTLRSWRNYQADLARRDRDTIHYYPNETIGRLIGRAVVTIVPVANLWAAAFDVAPRLFSGVFDWIGRVFNQPLVPQKRIER